MAKRILKDNEWGLLMNNIHRGKCFTSEAQRLGMTVEEIISQGDKKFPNSKEWAQCKRESAPRDKKANSSFRKGKKPVLLTPVSAVAVSTESALEPSTESIESIEMLLEKKTDFERDLEIKKQAVETAKSILSIRQKTLEDAKIVLEKAKKAFDEADLDASNAQNSLRQAEKERNSVEQGLQRIEARITDLKNSTVYLVDPWYSGKLPEFGTFISTVEMEGVTLHEVPEEYLPEATVEGILLFDYVPDYKKARAFVGLVMMYELEGTPYTLLCSKENVMALIKMNI